MGEIDRCVGGAHADLCCRKNSERVWHLEEGKVRWLKRQGASRFVLEFLSKRGQAFLAMKLAVAFDRIVPSIVVLDALVAAASGTAPSEFTFVVAGVVLWLSCATAGIHFSASRCWVVAVACLLSFGS